MWLSTGKGLQIATHLWALTQTLSSRGFIVIYFKTGHIQTIQYELLLLDLKFNQKISVEKYQNKWFGQSLFQIIQSFKARCKLDLTSVSIAWFITGDRKDGFCLLLNCQISMQPMRCLSAVICHGFVHLWVASNRPLRVTLAKTAAPTWFAAELRYGRWSASNEASLKQIEKQFGSHL